jgi:hypothetical protein
VAARPSLHDKSSDLLAGAPTNVHREGELAILRARYELQAEEHEGKHCR